MDADLSFGRWLKRRRKALDLTQDQLARKVSCAVGTIRKLEADALQPSREIAARLAEQLAVPIEARADFIAFARGRAHVGEFLLPGPPLDQAVWRPLVSSHGAPPGQLPGFDSALRYPLPVPLTPLIGRSRDVASVCAALQRADVRLLTLLGPPGVGKTRLSLQVASDLRAAFPTGVCFVALAPIRDPDLVPAIIARALDVHEAGDRPLVESLQAYLRDKQLLLVLDNIEQVVAAAPVITELLAGAPDLKVLSTSRIALHLSGEHEYAVPALELPDLLHLPSVEALIECPAVALFQARAQAVQPNFVVSGANAQAVAAICHRLDGLPLVIELAATRSKVFTPEALLARLDQRLPLLSSGARDLPPRQQTLRSAIAWSYDLLSAAEQTLFERLGVFGGGCTFEAAEAICGSWELGVGSWGDEAATPTPISQLPTPMLDGLTSLIDQSLVQQAAVGVTPNGYSEPRFIMLETIREYALERLAEHGEEQMLRRRYAMYYLTLAEQAEQGLQGSDSRRWLDRLEAEHDNLRAVLVWSQRVAGDQELGLRLAAALWWFWWARGHGSEGRYWLEQALSAGEELKIETEELRNDRSQFSTPNRPESTRFSIFRAKALVAAGVLAAAMDVTAAREPLEVALAIYQELEDQPGCAFPLVLLGWLSAFEGDPTVGQALIEEGLTLFRMRPTRDRWGFGRALFVAALVAMQRGDYGAARGLCEESLVVFRALGQPYGISQALNYLGDLARLQGNYAEAAAYYAESLPLVRQASVKSDIASLLHNLGYVALVQGDSGRAAALFGEGLALQREIGHQQGIAECLAGCAAVAAAQGQGERAAHLFGAADALSAHAGGPVWPAEQAEYMHHQAAARAQLPTAVWEGAWAAGRAMPLAQAIEEALIGHQTAVPIRP
jgi:predicted ATPase/transcriptional regulator with XRE-family HTH domain